MNIQEKVKDVVIQILTEIQRASGQATELIDGNTKPVGDLTGFDSLNVIEAVVMLSAALNFDLTPDIFLEPINGTPPTVHQIVDRICGVLKSNNWSVV